MIQSKTNLNEYYFGLIPDDYKNIGNGDQYYYKLTVDDEGFGNGSFTIDDNMGNSVPFDFELLHDLVTAITALSMAVDNAQLNQ